MRTTNDKKDNRVVVRLNDADNEYLREVSSRCGMSISDYIREMIQRDKAKNFSEKNKKSPRGLGIFRSP